MRFLDRCSGSVFNISTENLKIRYINRKDLYLQPNAIGKAEMEDFGHDTPGENREMFV